MELTDKQKREMLLRRIREENELHDIYVDNPEIKLAWYKKYNKEEFIAYLIAMFFMLSFAGLIVYFFKIGYFEPKEIDRKVMQVEVKNVINRGETIVRVFHEDTANKTVANLTERVERGLLTPNNNPNHIEPSSPPNVSSIVTNNVVVHLDPLSRPFDLHVDTLINPCKEILVEPGQKINIAQITYYRQYDKAYYYDFIPVDEICKFKDEKNLIAKKQA